VQPRERGGKRLAQRYRFRTPAMAAGRTHRRWTTREVLSCPLPKVPLERYRRQIWLASSVARKSGKRLAEALGGKLASGRGGLTELLKDQIQPEVGLKRADRFIHHIQWEYRTPGGISQRWTKGRENSFTLCWLLGTSVRGKRWISRTDVPLEPVKRRISTIPCLLFVPSAIILITQ
jgi:hypothetical protein